MAVGLERAITVPHDHESECFICLDKDFSAANPAKSHTGAHPSHKYVCHESCLRNGPVDRIKCACGAFFSRRPEEQAAPDPKNMSEIVRQIGSGAGAMVGAAVGGVIGGGIQYGCDLISRPQPVDERAPLGERIGRSIRNHRWTIAGTVIGAKVGSTLGSIAFLPVTIAVREFEEARGDFAKAAVFAGAVAGAFFLPQLIGVEYVLASELVRNTGCAIGACAVGAAARFFGWR